MKRVIGLLAAAVMLCCVVTTTQAAPTLSELAFNINGTTTDYPYGNPVWPTIPGFDTSTGLGSITLNYVGAGTYYVGAFFDHDIPPGFATDFGTVSGTVPVGVTWQIDDPWLGSIYANFTGGALDNTNYQPYIDTESKYNVSMAMARNFALDSTHRARVVYTVSGAAPNGFYLQQTNAETGESIYLSSTLDIYETPSGVPEPSTMALIGLGAAGLALLRAKKQRQ